jgi:hypothetical protein
MSSHATSSNAIAIPRRKSKVTGGSGSVGSESGSFQKYGSFASSSVSSSPSSSPQQANGRRRESLMCKSRTVNCQPPRDMVMEKNMKLMVYSCVFLQNGIHSHQCWRRRAATFDLVCQVGSRVRLESRYAGTNSLPSPSRESQYTARRNNY